MVQSFAVTPLPLPPPPSFQTKFAFEKLITFKVETLILRHFQKGINVFKSSDDILNVIRPGEI